MWCVRACLSACICIYVWVFLLPINPWCFYLFTGMIPLWLFTLGQHFMPKDSNINIPYQNIFISLVGILIPVGIGIIIQKKKPDWARKIIKLLRPFLIIFLVFMFTFGVWVNMYIFKLFTPSLILAGCLLPYLGFLLGGVAAFVLRQPFPRILTIAIETGIQNTGIPIILLRFSLPQPDGDLSLVSPVVAATFTPIPLLIAVAVMEIRKRCCKKGFKEVAKEDETANGDSKATGNYLKEDGEAEAEVDGDQTKLYPLVANGDNQINTGNSGNNV